MTFGTWRVEKAISLMSKGERIGKMDGLLHKKILCASI